MDSDGFLLWQRGRGSAPTSCSWTLGLRWRLPCWLASGTNGAELTVEGGEHGGIGSYRANSRGRSGAEGDGEEQEHVPRGEQLAGENAGRQQIAVTKSLYDRTLIRRKQGREPNVPSSHQQQYILTNNPGGGSARARILGHRMHLVER